MQRVEIAIGWACNNNCMFCVEGKNRMLSKEKGMYLMPLKDIKKKIHTYKEQGYSHLTLLGGEPTIHPDFIPIVEYAKKLGYRTISVTTNARRLAYKSFASRTVKAGVNEFCVSIHGSNSYLHDAQTRTPESFAQAIKGLKNLLELKQKVMTNTVINKINYKHLPELSEHLVKLNLEKIEYYFLQPHGTALELFDSSVPRYSDVLPYIYRSIDICKKHNKHIKIAAIPLCLMKGYEKYIDELNWSARILITHLYEPIVQGMCTGKKKVKRKSCKRCRCNDICEGVWEEYVKRYGFSEFKPILSKISLCLSNKDDLKIKGIGKHIFTEFLALKAGLKKAQRADTEEKDYSLIRDIYSKNAIQIAKSDFKVVYNQGLKESVPMSNNQGRLLFYASKDKSKAEDLKRLESICSKQDCNYPLITRQIGSILGYPDCCIGFFIENHKLPTPSILFQVFKNTKKKAYAELNIFEEDPLISHIPHSFDCKESIDYAKKLIKNTDIDRKNLVGSYIYFKNGCFIKINIGRNSGNSIPDGCNSKSKGKYQISTISNGMYEGSFDEFKLIEDTLEFIKKGDSIQVNDKLTIYKENNIIFEAEGKNKDWIFVEFE